MCPSLLTILLFTLITWFHCLNLTCEFTKVKKRVMVPKTCVSPGEA
jgi:hypothetical protein